MQPRDELETWYRSPDPWGYRTNPDDLHRLERITANLAPYAPFDRAIDIGCGEGFITETLPAAVLHGIELSDHAASRLPTPIQRVSQPDGKYDLVVCTGVLYNQYDWKQATDWIAQAASRIVLTCHIKDWEINNLPIHYQVHEEEFPYRDYTQRLRVFEWQ